MMKTFFLICILSVNLFAKESPPADDHSKDKGGAGKPVDRGLPPWFHTETRLGELIAKVKAKEEALEKAILAKKNLKDDSTEAKAAVELIVKDHKELMDLIEEYNKNLNLLKYRFPERGLKTQRNYKKKEVKSLEQMENTVGLEGTLQRNMKRLRQQFGDSSKEQKRGVATSGANSDGQYKSIKETVQDGESLEVSKPKSIEDADPVVIQK
jgi:hypothetical protein